MPLDRIAGEIFNMLPDRVNLFGRYITGVGNTNLKLDPSTEQAIIRSTEKQPTRQITGDELDNHPLGDHIKSNPNFKLFEDIDGPGIPASGDINPYNYTNPDNSFSNKLCRFSAEVTPDSVQVKDVYDMVNEAEDPDLVSGKFQPGKAFKTIRASLDPNIGYNPKIDKIKDLSHLNQDSDEYHKRKALSPTSSKATDFARAFMYLLPKKFKSYEIDYTIPRRTEY